MRVLLNTIPFYGNGPGLRTYTAGLLRGLHACDADMEWHVILRPVDVERLGLCGDPRFHMSKLSALAPVSQIPGARFVWRNATDQLLVAGLSARFDAVHYLDSYGPLLPARSTPVVLTVHDLLPLRSTTYFRRWVRAYLAALMRRTIPRATSILAVSEHTRGQLAATLGIAPERIAVVPNGVDDRFRPATPVELRTIAERYRLPGPYVLYVGSINPRKNIARLVRAFARARRELGLPIQLVLAGGLGWQYDDALHAIDSAGLGDAIRLLGHVPDEDLPVLIAGADCLAYPSLDEGFGLPVLEAMACGAPVLTSTIPALAEVTGGAAVLVEPTDEESIASGLCRMLGDAELQARLGAAGLERARQYGWRRVGEAVAAVYTAAAGRFDKHRRAVSSSAASTL